MRTPLPRSRDRRPLIAHVVYRLDTGGLENGVVNLINRLPPERFAHCVVSLTGVTDFRRRIERPDVDCIALHKRPGKDLALQLRLLHQFRRLSPDIVHTRNLATLESQVAAWLAGVPVRIHGEHGWDVDDVHAGNRKNCWLRRALRPAVHRYVAVSEHISGYLQRRIGVSQACVAQIYNGVDTERFRPGSDRRWVADLFGRDDVFVIGAVERLQAVKDPLTLARAFGRLIHRWPHITEHARLVIVGAGPLQAELEAELRESGVRGLCWLAGNRDDIPQLLRGLDLFVLPSLAEGISNTILEAMASGLPVVATAVGGNPELVVDGETGTLVPAADVDTMADVIAKYVGAPAERAAQGAAGRRRVEARFSLAAMVDAYGALYEDLFMRNTHPRAGTMRRETGA